LVVSVGSYREFLEAKRPTARVYGDTTVLDASGGVHPRCKPHQAAIIRWAVEGGRRAIFANFGLGKTAMQLEAMRLTLYGTPDVGLIVCPLGVRREFQTEALELGFTLPFVRTSAEIAAPGLYLTNYESVREGKIDVSRIAAVSLDEASVLRGMGGTKTFREFMRLFDRTPFRFLATATPSPNDYIELLSYAAFLGIMDVGEAKTRFFKRNSEQADQLTIHPHKVEEFWLWVNSWAVFLQKPSDLGFSDDGYDLPPMQVEWIQVDAAAADAGVERDGQGKLLRTDALGLSGAAKEKRVSMPARIAKVRELVEASPEQHVIIWHDLEDERRALESAVPELVSVYGSQDLDEREDAVAAFAHGAIARLAGKPVMLGSGCNLQRHCHWAIFAGVSFKFNDFIQAIHRIYRFLQTEPVRITIVYGAAEAEVVRVLQAKWKRHDVMMARMRSIIREYGLNPIAAHETLVRSIGVARQVASGNRFTAINADTVEETAAMPSDSVGLIVTSIPFGTQYEYTPSYNDFGHTDDDGHFFAQMDFLSPELLRVLQPGRVCCVHVKDRIRPGGLDGLGFQTVSPFHAHTILHYQRHGFVYMGMITVVTDVVRENAQTYRLGWSMQCDDGSRMSVGMPEYVLLFRKPPSDSSDGYADEPVVKSKAEYSRGRWQTDAHAYWRSNGNRVLCGEDLIGLEADEIFKRFRGWTFATIYDYERAVSVADVLDTAKRLPPGFQLLQPASWHPDVWTDVARMRTLNGAQEAKGREMHLCPLQFDIVDRLIARFSNADDVVYDPFAGLFTVPLQAVKHGRRGLGVELNAAYFGDGVRYLRAAEEALDVPTLFDLLDAENAAETDENAVTSPVNIAGPSGDSTRLHAHSEAES
jgi:hypothetical protein